MARKRKYAKSGDKAVASECVKQKCKWQGTEDQKAKRRKSDGWTELVCPNCGGNTFYGLLEKPSAIQSS